jgi:osmoprotectant transport system ATP-binding protein
MGINAQAHRKVPPVRGSDQQFRYHPSVGGAREPMIVLDQVTKSFGDGSRPAVSDLSLEVAEGEVACLVGPSGCGKTTTLRMINRLVEPSSGRILVSGRDVRSVEPHELRRGIGYVIQQVGLFSHRTIADNVGTVPRLLGWERQRIDARVAELLDLVGLEASLGPRYPAELSGGQQQRVGVARALASDPPVLLMDEPFGAVDPIVRSRLQDELAALQQRLRKTIVFVTHDIDEAVKLGDRIMILNVGGVVEQVGRPVEVLARPANAFVEQFIGPERGIRRLALVRVRDVDLVTDTTRTHRAVVRDDSTLLDSLQTMLRAGAYGADVVDDSGAFLGRLTLDRISREVG